MAEDVLNPAYWRQRLKEARLARHAVYHCTQDQWLAHQERHRVALAQFVRPTDAVLDAGCGMGYLLEVMPADWFANLEAGRSDYAGVDLSPAFIRFARRKWAGIRVSFHVGDLRAMTGFPDKSYDVAVLRSVKYTLITHAGQQVWDAVEREVRRVARHLLFLEFDPAEEPVLQETRL